MTKNAKKKKRVKNAINFCPKRIPFACDADGAYCQPVGAGWQPAAAAREMNELQVGGGWIEIKRLMVQITTGDGN